MKTTVYRKTKTMNRTFLIFDHRGLFVDLARRLSQTGARVLYHLPEDRRDTLLDAIIGDGIEGVECVDATFGTRKRTLTASCFRTSGTLGFKRNYVSKATRSGAAVGE